MTNLANSRNRIIAPSLDPNRHNQGMTGPVGYRHVDDIKNSRQLLLDIGARAQQEVNDVGGGKLLAFVRDTDSNIVGLIQLAGSGSSWALPEWYTQVLSGGPQAFVEQQV